MSLLDFRPSWKLSWLFAFLLPVAWQLWVPPYTGLASNGDFPKVTGKYSLGPLNPSEQDTFHYFIREWREDAKYAWQSPYWGVEVWLTRLAIWIGGTKPFDIRWLGLVHTALFAAFAWLAIARSPAANLFAILAFTDAAYVTYFQSFYLDAAALLFFLLLAACWWREAPVWITTFAALGFALSKGPHAPAALILAAIMLMQRKRSLLLPAIALILGGVYMLSQTRAEYKATAYYNLAFFKLAAIDPGSLDALHIRAEDRRLAGTHAFMPGSPAQSEAWLKSFYPKGGYVYVAAYYAAHPLVAARILYTGLNEEARQIRAINLGNYERSTGVPYCALSKTFAWYSDAKSWLFQVVPWHVALLLLAAVRFIKTPWVLAGILGAGTYEFAVASLADACETYRHLLLFHASYDLLLWMTIFSATQSKQDIPLS